MKNLRDKICIVTGAASGIGRATAIELAKEGARLILTDIDEAGLNAVVAAIEKERGKVVHAQSFDVSSFDAVQAFAKEVHGKVPSVDMILNVAGVSTWGSIETLAHGDWRKMIDVNLMGPIQMLECFVPPMVRAGKGGHIVNVSSAAGLFGLPWHAAYSASKFGIRGVSEVLRFDLAQHRIAVSLVCPGAVDTGLVETIQVRGVDMQNPAVKQLRSRFQRHAVKPETAAKRIVRGIKRNKYLIFTSPDIRFGYLGMRLFPKPYEWLMLLANRQAQKAVKASGASIDP